MDLKLLKKITGLPVFVLRDALLQSNGSENNLQQNLMSSIVAHADKKRNNPTMHTVYGIHSLDRNGVVVPLSSETNSDLTSEHLTSFAKVIARDILLGLPIEEDVDELLSETICHLGENVTSKYIYHWNNEDNNVTGYASSYLGKTLALVTLEGVEGATAKNLADLIALNALYYLPDFLDYYPRSCIYEDIKCGKLSDDVKDEFLKLFKYQHLIFPSHLRGKKFHVTRNTTREFHVVDDLLKLYEKEHHLTKKITIADVRIFGI
jgi:hypothetical protein